ncbi:MAG: hypothetical protein QME07_06600 [bacterium]|nr:hypothetical protein [bacterium]
MPEVISDVGKGLEVVKEDEEGIEPHTEQTTSHLSSPNSLYKR